jgi:hypothetical protein
MPGVIPVFGRRISTTLEVGELGGEDGAEDPRSKFIRRRNIVQVVQLFVDRGRFCS